LQSRPGKLKKLKILRALDKLSILLNNKEVSKVSILQILILALVQGAAELLPVSSSAHVIVAEKLLGLDPSAPEMTFLLVMLHTGTMFAVLMYFGKRWSKLLRSQGSAGRIFVFRLFLATVVTGVVGFALKTLIERLFLPANEEIEALFGNLLLISVALFAAGVLIVIAGTKTAPQKDGALDNRKSFIIGAIQGLCLPFRGFSRSGATISTAIILGVPKALSEDFSFALAVILTPAVVAREGLRLLHFHNQGTQAFSITAVIAPGLLGMVLSFISGLVALKILSRVLESGSWKYFGYYCFLASAVVATLHLRHF
jgi:undecaprenyl-diphosphatase